MINWFTKKENEIKKLTDKAMQEFICLVGSDDINDWASFWLDSRHCIFGFVENNGRDDIWAEIHLELRDIDDEEELIGDLMVLCSGDTSEESIRREIEEIIKAYVGE